MTGSRARAARALVVEVVDTLDRAEALAGEWADLADRTGVGPFGTPAFALAWWRHLGRGELRLVTVRNGAGDLVGLGPLHERRRGGLSVMRWIGHGLGTVGSLLIADSKADVAGAIWSAVASDGRILDLTEYRHRGAGLAELRLSDSWTIRAELRDLCPTIDLAPVDSVTELLAGPSRRGVRKQLAKLDRRVDASDGDLGFELVTSAADLDRAISAIDPIFDAAERDRPRLHLLADPYRPFLVDALRATAERERLALIIAHLEGRPIGFDVHVVIGSVANAWLGRFDPAAAEWSPGHLLLRAGVDWAIGAGMATLDLQLGADEYKQRWADDSYDTLRVIGATDATRLRSGRAALGVIDTAFGVRERLKRRRDR